MKRDTLIKRVARGLAVTAFWLALWALLARVIDKELLLPYPWTALATLGRLCVTLSFWENVLLTLLRILAGILSALICGTLLAVLTCRSRLAYQLLYPLITVIRATPVASFIILVWIWLGSGKLPVFICFLMVLPIVWAAVSDGIRALDPKLSQVCEVYRLSFAKRLRYFYVPSVLPYFLSACKTSIGMGWKAGVAAEVLAVTPVSVGKQLYNSKLYLETPELFAWTAVVILLSLLIETLTGRLIERLQKRRSYAED